MSCDPQTLLSNSGEIISRVPAGLMPALKLKLLCDIAAGGSGPIPPVACSNAEVDTWLDRALGNGSTGISDTTLDAACEFMNTLTAEGLRSSILRLNLFAGNDKVAARTPIIVDAGNALIDTYGAGSGGDTDAFYQETGVGGGFGKGGVPNIHLNTGITPSTAFASINSMHLSSYVTTALAESSAMMGVWAPLDDNHLWYLSVRQLDGNSYAATCKASTQVVVAEAAGARGFYLSSRTSAVLLTYYKNGVSIGTSAGAVGLLPTSPVFILAVNGAGLNATKKCGGYSIGLGMTAAQQLAFYNAWQTFETALGRQA